MAGPSGQPQLFCAILGFVLHDNFIMIKNVMNIAKIMSKPRPSRAATRDSHVTTRSSTIGSNYFLYSPMIGPKIGAAKTFCAPYNITERCVKRHNTLCLTSQNVAFNITVRCVKHYNTLCLTSHHIAFNITIRCA